MARTTGSTGRSPPSLEIQLFMATSFRADIERPAGVVGRPEHLVGVAEDDGLPHVGRDSCASPRSGVLRAVRMVAPKYVGGARCSRSPAAPRSLGRARCVRLRGCSRCPQRARRSPGTSRDREPQARSSKNCRWRASPFCTSRASSRCFQLQDRRRSEPPELPLTAENDCPTPSCGSPPTANVAAFGGHVGRVAIADGRHVAVNGERTAAVFERALVGVVAVDGARSGVRLRPFGSPLTRRAHRERLSARALDVCGRCPFLFGPSSPLAGRGERCPRLSVADVFGRVHGEAVEVVGGGVAERLPRT